MIQSVPDDKLGVFLLPYEEPNRMKLPVSHLWWDLFNMKLFFFIKRLLSLKHYPISSLHWLASLSFLFIFVHWRLLQSIKLSVGDVIVSKKVPVENESGISLSGTILLLALFARNLICAQRYILSRSSNPVSHFLLKVIKI